MDDKDRELVAQVLHAAGTATQEGFAAMVKYQWADGFTDVIGSLFAILVIVAIAITVLKLKFKDWEEGDRIGIRLFVCVPGVIATCVIFQAGLMSGITKMIAPEGAAIHSVLRR